MPRQSTRKLVRNEIHKALAKKTEVKHREVSAGSSITTDPVAYNFLEFISNGDSANQRDGNRVNLLSQSLRCNFRAESPYSNIRMCVLETREELPYDAVLSKYNAQNVLSSSALGVNSSLDYDSVKKVHYDRTFQIQQLASGVNPVHYVKKYIRFGGKLGKKIFYDGNTTTMGSGNCKTFLYIVFMSDSGATPHPQVSMGINQRYTDS